MEAMPQTRSWEVEIESGPGAPLRGELTIPRPCLSIVVILHSEGSGARALAERFIAQALNNDGSATLSLTLTGGGRAGCDPVEHSPSGHVECMAAQLAAVTQWIAQSPDLQPLNIGYFASGTQSASAFVAAARAPDYINAIVAVAGRPDLAGAELDHVRAASLLIALDDGPNHQLNRKALERLHAEKNLTRITSAGPLFDDPGALKKLADLTSHWFVRHLMSGSHSIPA